MLADAIALLRAGDDAGARRALIAAWQVHRSPTLAALIDLIDERSPDDVHAKLREIVRPKVVHSEDRLREVAELDDPRVSKWALDALADPPFESKTAEPFLTTIVAIAARDPRLRDRHIEIVTSLAARIGFRPMRNRLIEAVDAAAGALDPAPPSADEAELARLLEPLRKRGRSEDALLADIYANPDDDGPREVYADLLLERGHPHGELIRLQLARGRGGAISDRERWLIKTHGKDFLGPLAPVLSFGPRHARTRLERGFVSVADFLGSGASSEAGMRRRIGLVIDAPAWGTVELLEASVWTVELLRRAPLRALRRVDGRLTAKDLVAIAARREPLGSFATLEADAIQLSIDGTERTVRTAFPNLDTLVVHHDADATPAVSSLTWLGAFATRRVVIERYWTRDAAALAVALAHHQELVGALVGSPAFCPELAIQPPWHARPKPAPIVLRAVNGVFTSPGA